MSAERLIRVIKFAQIVGVMIAAHLAFAFFLNILAQQPLQ